MILMKQRLMLAIAMLAALSWSAVSAQAQTSNDSINSPNSGLLVKPAWRFSSGPSRATQSQRFGFSLMPAGSPARVSNRPRAMAVSPMAPATSLAVQGNGTLGRLTKWTAFTNNKAFIGDTTIFESSDGNVGIGTTSPGSTLTVVGMIETTLGGYKFPDGTIQTTAATSGISSVAHNSTLTGNGTVGSSLGVAVPLNLTGATGFLDSIIRATNTADAGRGVEAFGGPGGVGLSATGGNSISPSAFGSPGVLAQGGNSSSAPGGLGVEAHGGGSSSSFGGVGVLGFGGSSSSGEGGLGVFAQGGSGGTEGGAGILAQGGIGDTNPGGRGGSILGGRSNSGEGGLGLGVAGGDSTSNNGGVGVNLVGGTGNGAGHTGGIGIVASAGIGSNGATPGLAGAFLGDVVVAGNFSVTGNLSKGGGSFKIDHPLDPENKYLLHSFVESPDMMNIYNGNIVTDESGHAVVKLPEYFEALNFEFRYQLTVIGQFAQAIVSSKIKNNEFTIMTSSPGVEVSWQVTGVRRDAWATKNRITVEVKKKEDERGLYLHPEAFGQTEDRGIQWQRQQEHSRPK